MTIHVSTPAGKTAQSALYSGFLGALSDAITSEKDGEWACTDDAHFIRDQIPHWYVLADGDLVTAHWDTRRVGGNFVQVERRPGVCDIYRLVGSRAFLHDIIRLGARIPAPAKDNYTPFLGRRGPTGANLDEIFSRRSPLEKNGVIIAPTMRWV